MIELKADSKSESAEIIYDEYGYTPTLPPDFEIGIPEKLRLSALIVIVVELCERFAYYGAAVMFTTYMQEKLGVQKDHSVSINQGFNFIGYAFTLLGGYLSDQYLGKYKTIVIFSTWYFLGTSLLTVSTISSLPQHTSFILFILSIYVFIGIGSSGLKSSITTFAAEQVRVGYKPTGKPGEYYDSKLTVQKCYRYFYWAINVGALFSMIVSPAVSTRTYVGAYGISAGFMALYLTLFVSSYKIFIHKNPSGSIFKKVYACFKYARQHKSPENENWLDASKGVVDQDWDDKFVEGLQRAIKASKVFLFYPFFYALYGNMSDNFINQGLQMKRPSWIQSSQLNAIHCLVVIVFIPVLDVFFFPVMARFNISMGPIKRILIGFIILVLTFIYVTVLQKFIYNTPPYYDFTGPDITVGSHNDISIWWQLPVYITISFAEIFASVTGIEYAFSQAPPELKSFLQALFLFTSGCGSILSMVLSLWSYDPAVMYSFAAQTVIMTIITVIFWLSFKKYDSQIRDQE
ncbi:hypothetical protein BB559_003028 [Furculomyces boomerangus]|uniref:Major facilitator superfamily (MFS) profile domain-containing protein n=1 Tax=Furculomyces boomerangus TaxID=61424 RepID=A0A2T9YPZ0_9FUNG|nr:hypothetical protein BB559_003028 [Furculomyces boomerangus]